jgi:archaellum component FlaF (FlaF/FlaG flagellin family)
MTMKFQQNGRRGRAGISPFLATVILVVITLMIGGILYSSFRQMIVAQVKNPSVTLLYSNVSPDGETMTLDVKNDGNVPVLLQAIDVSYGATSNTFKESGASANITMISSSSGGATMQPGDSFTAKVKTNFQVPGFATFTVTVVGDQVAKAFNIQA